MLCFLEEIKLKKKKQEWTRYSNFNPLKNQAKLQQTTLLFIYFIFFSLKKKIRFDVSCESSEISSLIFFEKQ